MSSCLHIWGKEGILVSRAKVLLYIIISRWKLVLSENKDSEFISAATGHWIMKEDLDLVSSKIIERLRRFKGLGNKN
jgi:hypothetical protein